MAINGLDRITEKILAEARQEADRIISDAEAECARISAEYAARAEAIRESLTAEAERKGTDLIARAKSAAATKKRNTMLQTRAQLIDDVFDGTLASLRNLTGEKYTEVLAGLLCSAVLEQVEAEKISSTLYGEEEAMAPERYEVLLNARDRERVGKALIDAARKQLSGKLSAEVLKKLMLSEKTVSIDGGLILRCGDIESNCSFALLFAQLREELEGEVSRALFDTERRN